MRIKKTFSQLVFNTFLLILTTSTSVLAQGYGTAVGIRVGDGIGLTAKQQIALRATGEVILSSKASENSTTLSLLAMRHVNILTRTGNFYIGGGGHRTWISGGSNYFGLSAIGGFELNFKSFNFSADYKPQFNFGSKLLRSEVGISLRYIIFDRQIRDDSWKFWKKW